MTSSKTHASCAVNGCSAPGEKRRAISGVQAGVPMVLNLTLCVAHENNMPPQLYVAKIVVYLQGDNETEENAMTSDKHEVRIKHVIDVDISAWQNGRGDWFTVRLLGLIANADLRNRERIRAGFPLEVEAYERVFRS